MFHKQRKPKPEVVELRCEHDSRAVCWLCSSQRLWWVAARRKAGLEIPPWGGVGS